jgi:hypothetical protein
VGRAANRDEAVTPESVLFLLRPGKPRLYSGKRAFAGDVFTVARHLFEARNSSGERRRFGSFRGFEGGILMDASRPTSRGACVFRCPRSPRPGLRALLLLVLVGAAVPSRADQFTIMVDTQANAPKAAEDLGGAITKSDRQAPRTWESVGATDDKGKLVGSLIKNLSKSEVTDLEIELTSMTDGKNRDTFDRKSSGGALFKVKFLDANGNDVTNDPTKPAVKMVFSTDKGKGVAPGASFWMLVPKTAGIPPSKDDPRVGKGTYKGQATPMEVVPPKGKGDRRQLPDPNTALVRNDANPMICYTKATDTLTFQPGNVNFVRYSDGTTTRSNNSTESVIGSTISIDPMVRQSGPSIIPGAIHFSDSSVQVIDANGAIFHVATLSNNLLIPDPSAPGFGTLQSTLIMNSSNPGVPSRYVNEMLNSFIFNNDGSHELTMLFRTDILSATNNLGMDGWSTQGVLDITTTTPAAIPEPASLALAGAGTLGLVGYHWWRRRRRSSA